MCLYGRLHYNYILDVYMELSDEISGAFGTGISHYLAWLEGVWDGGGGGSRQSSRMSNNIYLLFMYKKAGRKLSLIAVRVLCDMYSRVIHLGGWLVAVPNCKRGCVFLVGKICVGGFL